MTHAMVKGSNIQLSASAVRAVLRWSPVPGAPDIDVSALLLGADGRVRSDEDFVFYNQPRHPSGLVRHRAKQRGPGGITDPVEVDLNALDASVECVVIAASVDRNTFGQAPELSILVYDIAAGPDAEAVAEYKVVPDTGEESALNCGELYRRGDAWKFRALGQGYTTGLVGLATAYGITVDDRDGGTGVHATPPPPAPEPEPVPASPPPASAPEPPTPAPAPPAGGYGYPPAAPSPSQPQPQPAGGYGYPPSQPPQPPQPGGGYGYPPQQPQPQPQPSYGYPQQPQPQPPQPGGVRLPPVPAAAPAAAPAELRLPPAAAARAAAAPGLRHGPAAARVGPPAPARQRRPRRPVLHAAPAGPPVPAGPGGPPLTRPCPAAGTRLTPRRPPPDRPCRRSPRPAGPRP